MRSGNLWVKTGGTLWPKTLVTYRPQIDMCDGGTAEPADLLGAVRARQFGKLSDGSAVVDVPPFENRVGGAVAEERRRYPAKLWHPGGDAGDR